MKRESFKSRLGFILVSAGCAIGIGNVWRFPYVTGQNGGGIFVLFYLIFLVCMGLPVLTMELAVGRASRKSAVMSYKALEKEGSKWHIHGWIAMLGCYMLMMYYTTVSGWMVAYFFKFLKGDFTSGMNTDDTAAAFGNMLADPKQMAFWMIVTVVLGFLVCSRGLQNGLEKISKFMMSALLLLIIVLAVHSITLSGALEGVKFYLVPNLDAVSEIGHVLSYNPVKSRGIDQISRFFYPPSFSRMAGGTSSAFTFLKTGVPFSSASSIIARHSSQRIRLPCLFSSKSK